MTPRLSLLAAATLAFAASAAAQVGTNYVFTQAVGTYTPITGGTLIAQGSTATTLDDAVYAVTLPFSFTYDGVAQTQIQVSTNGSIAFGGTSHGNNNYAALGSTAAVPGIVAAFARDLQAGYVFAATRTLGSPLLTNANLTSNGPLQVGDTLTGTGIPAGTVVVAISGNTITMSGTATSTGTTPTAVTAYGPWSSLRHDTTGAPGNQVFTVQWAGFRRFGTTLTTNQDLHLNFQIRLHEANGQIDVVYGDCTPGVTTFTTVNQVGLRGPTNAFPANVNGRQNTKGVNDNWLNSAASTSNTAGMVFNNVAPANVIPNGLTYTWIQPQGVPATNTTYGTGCYSTAASWYEVFGSFDLANTAVQMTPSGGGYTVAAGTPTAFVHTLPGLALTDDQNGTLNLPVPFNYPGGSTTALTICSNGFIWLQPNASTDFSPTAAELLSNPARLAPLWADMNPDGATNVNNVFAEVDAVANKAYVTWVNVPTFTAGGTVNMQVEFDLTTGGINYTYGAVTLPAITSVTGYSPGAATVDPGTRDLSATLPFATPGADVLALALSASPTPALGATVTYTTSNIPPSALISANLVSLIQVNPGLPLGATPAGCSVYVDLPTAFTVLLFGGPTATQSIAVPTDPFWVGLPINVQSASLVPGINSLDVITSNGVRSVVGNF